LAAAWTAGHTDKHCASDDWLSPSDARHESSRCLPSLLDKQPSQDRHNLGSHLRRYTFRIPAYLHRLDHGHHGRARAADLDPMSHAVMQENREPRTKAAV